MLVSSHVLAGAIIGRTLAQRPVAAFTAGLVSHFAMDACPHWGTVDGEVDDHFFRVAKCDGCAGLAAMAVSAGMAPGRTRRAVVAGMVGGALPDIDKPMEYFFGYNPWPAPVQKFHKWVQNESPHRLPQEVVTAGLLAGAVVVLLTRGR